MMNPELVKQAILKEETSFIQDKVDNASFDEYFGLKNSLYHQNNLLMDIGHFLSFLFLGVLIMSSEIFLLPLIQLPNNLSFLTGIGLISVMMILPFIISFWTGCKGLNYFYKHKLSVSNYENKFELYRKMYRNSFYHQEVNSDIRSLLKLSLNNDEYYQLATANKHIDYIHALDAINEKIKKENILSEKMEVSLDLKKMKEYNIEILNS